MSAGTSYKSLDCNVSRVFRSKAAKTRQAKVTNCNFKGFRPGLFALAEDMG